MTTPDLQWINPPIKVHWLGWESDTHTLSRNGWDLSASEDPCMEKVSIAIRHAAAQIYGISEFQRHRYRMRNMQEYGHDAMIRDLEFRMTLAHSITMQNWGPVVDLWKPVDARPQVVAMDIRRIEDLKIFRPLPPEENDIIIAPPSLDAILQMALNTQAPKQRELRNKYRRRATTGESAIIRVAA
jgi:hypothetical protein